jgi:putative transposase
VAKVIRELRQYHAQDLLLEASGMARSTFYYYLKKFVQPEKDSTVKVEIIRIYHQHKGRYGYRRITACLRNKGMKINHKKVERLMKEAGIKSLVRVKKYQSYKGQQGTIARNLLKRDFKARKPYQKWVTDVTEFAVAGKKLYFSPVLDLYNSEIVSYSISDRPDFNQTMDMLKKALKELPAGARPILHSDQGWQYQMKAYQYQLRKSRIRQSMSRKGNCLDNAVMENFFAILKTELFYVQKFKSYESLQQAIIDYVQYYNHDRIKLKLKGLSPVQYRTQAA